MLHVLPQSVLRTQRASDSKFGTQITPRGVRFRLWAPERQAIGLRLEHEAATRPMETRPRGWFELEVEGIGAGTLYRFVLDDGTVVPDPASRFQPEDVLGPSEVIDPRTYPWTDVGWIGRPWEEVALYELHVGTFTPQGTFRAAIDRLDYLADLGITAIQMMPVADFPGRWNWGYDGTLPFAPDSTYGRPDDLKALIDAAHGRGLMVLLDVVYNHFGPRGNFLPRYAPIFTERHETPWGSAMNFDGPGSDMVRDFILANARYWLTEYHFDGLRLDAVHEIKDGGFNHMLRDLALMVRGATDGRYIHLVLENEENDADWLRRTEDLRPGLYDAQWNDDIHHLIDVAVHGKRSNYAADYSQWPQWLPRALATGFGFQGQPAPSRHGLPKGKPSDDLPPTAFVSFIQNHDQVGNRLFGERVAMLARPEQQRAAAALYLLAPQIPMVMMGEEFGTKRPFLFFSDVDPALAEAIRRQRTEAFGKSVLARNRTLEPPDAMQEETFLSTKLDWTELESEAAAEVLAHYRRLLAVRRAEIVPRLTGVGGGAGSYAVLGPGAFRVDWRLTGATLSVNANLSDRPAAVSAGQGRRIWTEGRVDEACLGAWSLAWNIIETTGAPA